MAAVSIDLPTQPTIPKGTSVTHTLSGDTMYCRTSIEMPPQLSWKKIVRSISSHYPYWICWCGVEAVRRCTRADFSSGVSLTRGDKQGDCWLEIEGSCEIADELQEELASAFWEVRRAIDLQSEADREAGASSQGGGLPTLQEAMSVALSVDKIE